MCSRIEDVFTEKARQALLRVLGPLPWLETGRGDVRPTDQIQVVRPAEVGHELVSARRGFVPAGMGAPELQKYVMFNARIETLKKSRAVQIQRYVISLSAFYEWPTVAVDGKKQKTQMEYARMGCRCATRGFGTAGRAREVLWSRAPSSRGHRRPTC
jgi:putative SOS response-associated peptidase YedK